MRRPPPVVSLLLAGGLVACGAPSTERDPTGGSPGALGASPPSLAEGVTAMESVCTEGGDERCDALDSDCDGRIDEGCEGAAAGALEVAVAWTGVADLDLELEGPAGDGLAEAQVACEGERLERRTLARPAAGTYVVRLRHRDGCGEEGPVTASVTVGFEGRVLGTFNREVAPEQRADVVTFELAP